MLNARWSKWLSTLFFFILMGFSVGCGTPLPTGHFEGTISLKNNQTQINEAARIDIASQDKKTLTFQIDNLQDQSLLHLKITRSGSKSFTLSLDPLGS